MGATLPAGTPIRILLGRADGVGPGDVVAFVSGSRIVVHRIVGRVRGHWLTRGDAELIADPPVADDAVLGPVALTTAEAIPAAPPPTFAARAAEAVTRGVAGLSIVWAGRLAVVALRVASRSGLRRAIAEVGAPGGSHEPE